MGVYQRAKIWWIDYYYKGRRLREPVSESWQEAVDAQSDEDAKAESNETFDTPHDSDGN